MKLHLRIFRWADVPGRIRGMFNLNDSRWGRSEDKPSDGSKAQSEPPEGDAPQGQPKADPEPRRGANQGPPDLDALWRDFNQRLGGLFGGVKKAGRGLGGGGTRGIDDLRASALWIGQ